MITDSVSSIIELSLVHTLKTYLPVQIAELLGTTQHQALQQQVVVVNGGVLEYLPHDPVGD